MNRNRYRYKSHNSTPPTSQIQYECSLSASGSEPGRTASFVPSGTQARLPWNNMHRNVNVTPVSAEAGPVSQH